MNPLSKLSIFHVLQHLFN